MTIEVTRANLNAALAALHEVVERRDVIPVLTHVLIDARKAVVTLSATNIQTSASVVLDGAQASGDRAGTVPYSVMAAFCRALPDGIVTLTLSDPATCRIESGDASMRLGGLPAVDFPAMPSPHGEVLSVVPAAHLREVIRRLRKSTPVLDASDGTRAGMRLLLNTSSTVSGVSTDGHRMTTVGSLDGGGVAVVVPVTACEALTRFLQGCDDEAPVSAYMDENRAWWVSGQRTFTAQLLDGKFPAVEKVAKLAGGSAWVEVPREAFGRALGRVGVVAEKAHQSVEVRTDGDILRLSMRTLRGDVVELLRLNARGSDCPVPMLFQHGYLSQMVDVFGGETMRLEAAPGSDVGAARWRSPDDDLATTHVMMPMRGEKAAA
jgi:DNA polymerase-3 subunit beta